MIPRLCLRKKVARFPLETRFHFSVSISSTTLLSHRELKRGCCLVMFGQLNVPVRYEKSRGGRRSFPPFLEASHENPLIDRKLFGSMCRWNRGMASFREHWSSPKSISIVRAAAAAIPTLANVPWYREDNPVAIRFLADNWKLSLHGIQIGNPFMRKYRANTCERYCYRNIELRRIQ